jgi:hypothetical protein
LNPLNIIATLRKFGNFLVGLFPFLAVVGERLSRITGAAWFEKFIAWLKSKERLAPVGLAIERFFWKDYARDRLVAETFPLGALTLLRVCSVVALALSLFMPLAFAITKPAVPVELNSGTVSSAPTWAVFLWMVAAPLGWGAILAGAVQCHRVVFAVIGIACLYFVGSCALFLPRSYFNAIFAVAMLLAIHFSGYRSVNAGGSKNITAVLGALAVGIPTGIFLVILTPVQTMLKPNTLIWGSVTGAVLSLIALFTATLAESVEAKRNKDLLQPVADAESISGESGDVLGADVAASEAPVPGRGLQVLRSAAALRSSMSPVVPLAFTFAVIMFAFVASLVLRGGPRSFAEQLISSLAIWNGYLWPVWYFVGVGIVYKLLKNAKIMANTVRDLLPSKVFAPLAILLIVGAALVIWSPVIGSNTTPWLSAPTYVFALIYKSTHWFWEQSLNRMSATSMQWILLFDVLAIVWMAVKKQLSGERLATLLYFTLLSWLLIFEYNFQYFSFGQGVVHNVFLVIAFAIWLLWLFHTSVFAMCSQSTRSWPSPGRLGLYCGLITLCLLDINARTTVRDFRVSTEIFLAMFRGTIDIGLPYFIYVLSVRRFKQLPIRVLRIFQCFCAGALLTFPVNVLDKLAVSGWSMHRFYELWRQELTNLNTLGFIERYTPPLPESWLVVRSVLYVGALVAVFALVKDRLKDSPHYRAAVIFALLSFASGFGSFSKTVVDLPVPPELKVMISPFTVSLSIDFPWLFSYLSALLPVMFFLLCVTAKDSASKPCAGIAVIGAAAINYALMRVYPGYEAYLQSTGLINTVVLGGAALFLYMLFNLIWRLEETAHASTLRPKDSADAMLDEDEDAMAPVVEVASTADLVTAGVGLPSGLGEAVSEGETRPASEVSTEEAAQQKPLVGKKELNALAVVACVALVGAGYWQAQKKKLVSQPVASLKRDLMVPADWEPRKVTSPASTIFVAPGDPLNATLEMGVLPSNPEGAEALAASLVEICKKQKILPNFAAMKVERWKDEPGSPAAIFFSFTTPVGSVDMPRLGVTILVERENNKTEYFTACCSADELHARVGDLKRMLRSSLTRAHTP